MEEAWSKEFLELADRVTSITSFNQEQINLLAQGLQPCSSVLDLCTGFGNLAKVLVEQGKTVYGLDISTDSLNYAMQRAGRLYPVKGDVRKLPFNGGFDGVACASSLSFKELDGIVEGIYRALNPGGLFAVTGIESAKQEQGVNAMVPEILKARKDGKLKITNEELQKLGDFIQKISGGRLDSSQDRAEVFEKHGLHVRELTPFHQGTAYFILAKKGE